jgi:hypothetical protein
MNEELRTPITDEEELLQQLRDGNAERWKRLKEWHQQLCAEQDDDNDDDAVDEAEEPAPAAPKPRLHDMLQTELDLLPANELAQESSLMLRRISQLNNATTSDIDNADDERKYSIELVESYHELLQTNAILRQSIERERGRLRKMQDWKEQHQRVHETLQARHLEMANLDREHAEGDVDAPVSHDELQLENQRLKDHFRYVAEYIQKQREEPPPLKAKAKAKQSTNQPQPTDKPVGQGAVAVTYWSLDQLVFKLMERLRSSPEDPYLLVDVSPIDTEHVALLSRCHMLETFKDDINMIKLIDYEN